MNTLPEKPFRIGDAWETATSALAVALVVVAAVLLPFGVGWGAAEVASVFTQHLDPTRAAVVQGIAGVLAALGMAGVIFGIHRFTKRTPVVTR